MVKLILKMYLLEMVDKGLDLKKLCEHQIKAIGSGN